MMHLLNMNANGDSNWLEHCLEKCYRYIIRTSLSLTIDTTDIAIDYNVGVNFAESLIGGGNCAEWR